MSAPRGFLLIVGPDGAGKSTVADAIEQRAARCGARVVRAHHRPGVLRPGDPAAGPVTDPHRRPPWQPLLAALKLLAVLVDFLLGAARWHRQAETDLLVVERGWWDMAVDPRRYRLPAWAAPAVRLLGRLTPRADLVVLLSGDPTVLAARKREIDATETARQVRAWQGLIGAAGRRQVTVDTTRTGSDEAASRILRELDRRPRPWRRIPFAAPRLDLRATGRAAPAFAVHRPFTPLARVGAVAGRALYRVGATPRCPPPFVGVEDLLADLGVRWDGLVAFRSSGRDRWVAGIADGGTLQAVAKIGPADDRGLRNEADVLARLHGHTHSFEVPRVRDRRRWRDRAVVLTEARPAADGELTVDQAAAIATELTVGVDGIGPVVHGDLAPWNVVLTRDAPRPLVVDWEDARTEAAPLHDLAHFVIRAGALLSRWTADEAADLLTTPGSPGAAHLRELGIPVERAAGLVGDYLVACPSGSAAEARFRRRLARAIDVTGVA